MQHITARTIASHIHPSTTRSVSPRLSYSMEVRTLRVKERRWWSRAMLQLRVKAASTTTCVFPGHGKTHCQRAAKAAKAPTATATANPWQQRTTRTCREWRGTQRCRQSTPVGTALLAAQRHHESMQEDDRGGPRVVKSAFDKGSAALVAQTVARRRIASTRRAGRTTLPTSTLTFTVKHIALTCTGATMQACTPSHV